MHSAPQVRVGLARSRGWIGAVALVAALASANLIAWVLMHLQAGATAALLAGLGAPAAAALAAALAWRAQPPLVLRWDGAAWFLDELEGDARVVWDLDGWMLLRFVASHGRRSTRWIAASRARADGPWPALRSALYSRRPSAPDAAPV